MKSVLCVVAVLLFGSAALMAQEKKVTLESLPTAVQSAIKGQLGNATIGNIDAEKEHGVMTYEVETKMNGKEHDVTFNAKGQVTEIEDEATLDSMPAAAKAALVKAAAGGTTKEIEKVTNANGSKVSYEAEVVTKAGKNLEISVNADGTGLKKEAGDAD